MGVSINGGTPKWMVYSGTSQSKMDDLGGTPISGNPHIYIYPNWLGLSPITYWEYIQLVKKNPMDITVNFSF